MNRIALPIKEILVIDRQRKDYGDIDALADSIKRYGLIQPIVVNQEKRLIAGGRRLAACVQLNLSHVDVVFRETLTDDELHELELEENVRRKEMHWTERCINIYTIHKLKHKRAASEGERWGERETAEMLGIKSRANVNYAISIAEELLANKNSELWHCDGLTEAWTKVVLKREENRILAELAARSSQPLNAPAMEHSAPAIDLESLFGVETADPLSEGLKSSRDAMKEQYLRNPLNDPNAFDSYYESYLVLQREKEDHRNTIYISPRLRCCNSISFMQEADNRERFDHIITDIPYAIDMEMLDTFTEIETVEKEHEVEYNMQLIADFFPAAYACTKENSFTITWGDQMLWQYMYDCAIRAGFKVQRWPFIWCKESQCRNSAAQYNLTKKTEIAIVCRKGIATLIEKGMPNYVCASRHDEITDLIDHPFAKPLAVWEPLIKAVSIEGQEILEPFAGQGSGVLSLLQLKRQVTACELNLEHYNKLIENVKQHYLTISPNFKFA